jgi:hypothetical protein
MDVGAVSSGFACVYVGSDGQAIADYDKAIELSLKDTGASYNRVYAYSHLGIVRQASEDLKTAARSGLKSTGPVENKPGDRMTG